MKRLVLFALACSILSACGGGGSSSSGFSLGDVRAPALGKINLVIENLESQNLTGAMFSTTGDTGAFTDMLPSATSVGGRFVLFDQPPATYTFKYKFGTGATAVTSPAVTKPLTTANSNVQMGANTTNTGTVTSTPVTTSTSTFTTPSGYTCSDYNGSLGTKCNYLKSCVNSTTAANGFYQTNLGQYNFTTSNTSSIQAAATAAVNACQ